MEGMDSTMSVSMTLSTRITISTAMTIRAFRKKFSIQICLLFRLAVLTFGLAKATGLLTPEESKEGLYDTAFDFTRPVFSLCTNK
jgi:hypothetical protein